MQQSAVSISAKRLTDHRPTIRAVKQTTGNHWGRKYGGTGVRPVRDGRADASSKPHSERKRGRGQRDFPPMKRELARIGMYPGRLG